MSELLKREKAAQRVRRFYSGITEARHKIDEFLQQDDSLSIAQLFFFWRRDFLGDENTHTSGKKDGEIKTFTRRKRSSRKRY